MVLEERVAQLEKEVAELRKAVQPEEPKEIVTIHERIVHEKVLSNGYRQVNIISDPEIIERIRLVGNC